MRRLQTDTEFRHAIYALQNGYVDALMELAREPAARRPAISFSNPSRSALGPRRRAQPAN